MGRTIAIISKETLQLQSYIEMKKPGDVISFLKIEKDTGIKMDERGKQHLRSALHRAKIEYSSIRSYGVKLADPETTMGILSHRLTKIDKSVKRADKTQKNLQQKFFSELPVQEQRDILYIGSVFGAISAAAENGKLIYGRHTKKIDFKLEIPIPK